MKLSLFCLSILFMALFTVGCGGDDENQESSTECNSYASGAYLCRFGDSYVCSSVHEWVQMEVCYDGCDYTTGKCYSDDGNSGDTGNSGDSGDTGNSGDSGDTGDSSCEPDCSGKECGNDGCGGSCGTCDGGYDCTVSGQCVKNDSCATNDDCDDSMFCYQNKCQTPWGKSWEVTFISAEVTEKNPDDDDAAWDDWGGLPDLYAYLKIGDSEVFRTGVVADSTTATWNYSETVLFEASTEKILFYLVDEDIDVVDDYIIGVYRDNQNSWFRDQNISLTVDNFSDSGGLESFKFSLKPAW